MLEREVRANLVAATSPASAPARRRCQDHGVGVRRRADLVKQINERLVKLAQANGLAADTDARRHHRGGTKIDYPTDSSLFGDGVRVLIRTMKRMGKIAGETGAKLVRRRRSVQLRVLEICPAARSRASEPAGLNRSYRRTCSMRPVRVVGQAKQFSEDRRRNKSGEDVLRAAGA